jgi:hypothetical protein
VLQVCYKRVTRVLQECYKRVNTVDKAREDKISLVSGVPDGRSESIER